MYMNSTRDQNESGYTIPSSNDIENSASSKEPNESKSVKLSDNNVFFFSDVVTMSSVQKPIEFIMEKNFQNDKPEYLTLVVSSPGGSVPSGFALIDTMNASSIPVRTVGLGMIASMGLNIFLSGQRGHRVLTPNTMILSHQFSSFSFGKEHELFADQKRNEHVSEMILRHYERTTGLTREKIRERLLPESDVWLTADEAKDLNICDEVRDIKPYHMK